MKRKLFLSALLASFVNLSAQTTFSFETSEGYALGDIRNQNGWTVTGAGGGLFISGQDVTDELASDGVQSLKINQVAGFSGQSTAIMGAFYDFPASLGATHYSISADYYMSEVGGSNFVFYLSGPQSFISRFSFDYQGTMSTVEGSSWSAVPLSSWQANQWYNIKMEVNGTVVKYYINNNLIRTGTAGSTEPLDYLRFAHDNYGGFAYVDNIVITDMALSVQDFSKSFSVFPNPAKDIVHIKNNTNMPIDTVVITDMNGRIVKDFKFVSTSDAVVDIEDLSPGVYLMNISSDQGTLTKKIIKD